MAHLIDTAAVAGVLWDEWLPQRLQDLLTDALAPDDPGRARTLVQAAAGLHDVGKANPVFQLQAADSRQHEWRDVLAAMFDSRGLPRATPAMVAAARQVSEPCVRRHEYVGYLALTGGVHPDPDSRRLLGEHWLPVAREWERYQTQMRDLVSELNESFVPKPPEHQRDVPRTPPTTDRPVPGR